MSAVRVAVPLVLGLALGGASAFAPSRGVASEPPAPADGDSDDVQDLLLLTRPDFTLVRLHVRLGDQPLHAAWRGAVERFHRHIDNDGDGRVSRQEFSAVPWISLARLFGDREAPVAVGLALTGFARKLGDGVVTVDELAVMVRAVVGPIVLEEETAAGPAQAQDPTYTRLDRDGDGILSHAERARAAETLRGFDLNDDDLVSLAELSPSSAQDFSAPKSGAGTSGGLVSASTMVPIPPGASPLELAQEVVSRLDSSGPRGLRTLDKRLSPEELVPHLERLAPAIELSIRLGPPALKHYPVELVGPSPPQTAQASPVRMRRSGDNLTRIETGSLGIDVLTEDAAGEFRVARAIAHTAFRRLDSDKSQSLGLAEVQREEPFRSLYPLLDRNGDREVTFEEIGGGIDLLEELSRGQVHLKAINRGLLVFESLDANHDGRLSPRELQEASRRLEAADPNGEGEADWRAPSQRLGWIFSQRLMPRGVIARAPGGLPPAFAVRPTPTIPYRGSGMTWFDKMDRNHDGDLSPREFLGPRPAFDRLDADGDGLIDVSEARQQGRAP